MEPENFNQETQQVEQSSSLHKVTPLSKYLAMALFILLPFVGGYIGYTFAPDKIVEVEKEVIREVEVEKIVEVPAVTDLTDSGFLTYEDNDIGIAFEYPEDWGEITVDDEPGNCPADYSADKCNFRTLLLKDIYSAAIFLSAETKGHSDYPVGRGAFWGGVAGNMSADYLNECETADNCEIIVNSNSVSFAVYEADPPPEEMGYQPKRYYVYNPDSEYFGLVLSPHRLTSYSQDVSETFSDTVIETFRFIE